jgi:hypothetical protein
VGHDLAGAARPTPSVAVATTVPPVPLPEPSPLEIVPDAAASAMSTIASPEEITATATPVATHDAVTQPAKLPPELPLGMPEPLGVPGSLGVIEPLEVVSERRKPTTIAPPPVDEVDGGWDLGDDDPTSSTPPEATHDSPSSLEMAGDGSTEGDGLDTVD